MEIISNDLLQWQKLLQIKRFTVQQENIETPSTLTANLTININY